MLGKKKIYISLVITGVVIFCYIMSTRSVRECEIDIAVKEMLKEMSIQNCKLMRLCDYSNITYMISTPQVKEEEIESYATAIKEEYGIQHLDEAFVKNKLGFSSIDLFYESISSKLLEQKKVEAIIKARNFVVQELMVRSDFYIDEHEVATYALEILKSYEMEANLYNMSMEDYCVNILKIPYENIFDVCYEEAVYYIKSYLIVGAVMYAEYEGNFEITDYELQYDSYKKYQLIENEFYKFFIRTDADFD